MISYGSKGGRSDKLLKLEHGRQNLTLLGLPGGIIYRLLD